MPTAKLSIIANHRFFKNVSFEPVTPGYFDDVRTEKTFVDGSTLRIKEESDWPAYPPRISYSFEGEDVLDNLCFWLDPKSGECIGISGTSPYVSIAPRAGQTPADQTPLNEIFSEFLSGLRDVYSGNDFQTLAHRILAQASRRLTPPNPIDVPLITP